MFALMFVLISVQGTKHSAAPGSGSQKAAKTSLPTSNARGPIAHNASGLIAVLGYTEFVDFDFRTARKLCKSSWN